MNSRQQDIVTLPKHQGGITIKARSEHFGVTEMTIHRDHDFPEEQRE